MLAFIASFARSKIFDNVHKIARLERRDWLIGDLRYVFTNFSLEKLRTQVATLTHRVKQILTIMFGRSSVELPSDDLSQ